MSFLDLACIVEGHGETQALPIVLRRIAAALDSSLSLRIHPPLRIARAKLIKPGELERAVELAGRRAGPQGAIVVLLDSDDECPKSLAPLLLARARSVRSDLPISVILAKREFEAWFLAAAESLRAQRGLVADLTSPAEPEEVRGAKEWLTARMRGGRHYVETLDQSALAAMFDLTLARRAESFDKLFRDFTGLLRALSGTGKPEPLG